MTIDPARLERIRSRLLAAAAVTAVGAAGCSGPQYVNERAPDPPDTGVAGPINERAPEPTASVAPEEPPADGPDTPDVNRPKPDEPRVGPNVNTPDPGPAINTAAPLPSAAPTSTTPKKPPNDRVNRPHPDN